MFNRQINGAGELARANGAPVHGKTPADLWFVHYTKSGSR
jgi:hypothetical protein